MEQNNIEETTVEEILQMYQETPVPELQDEGEDLIKVEEA